MLELQVVELQKQNRELEKNQRAPTPRPSSARSIAESSVADEKEEAELDDAVDEEGQHPSNVKGIKAANLKIDKLIAEVRKIKYFQKSINICTN